MAEQNDYKWRMDLAGHTFDAHAPQFMSLDLASGADRTALVIHSTPLNPPVIPDMTAMIKPFLLEFTEEERSNSVRDFLRQWQKATDSMAFVDPIRPVWLRQRVPSKLRGRKGTRRAWKRKHPPRWLYMDLNTLMWGDIGTDVKPDGTIDVTLKYSLESAT